MTVWLWDTNILRAFTDRECPGHAEVMARGDELGWERIGLPVVVAAEVLDGRLRFLREAHSRAPRHLVVAFERFQASLGLISAFPVVPFDHEAARVFGRRGAFPGTMSRGDKLIAAIALAGDHNLVTRNVSHFVGIGGVTVENWIDTSRG